MYKIIIIAMLFVAGCGGGGISLSDSDPRNLTGEWELVEVLSFDEPVSFGSGYINFNADGTFITEVFSFTTFGDSDLSGTYTAEEGIIHFLPSHQGGGDFYIMPLLDPEFFMEGQFLHILHGIGPSIVIHDCIYQRI